MNFGLLVQSIAEIHRQMQARAVKAVNVGLTLRNWLIGAYISEYELRGEDRANYGERLMARLAQSLKAQGVTACEQQRLSSYRLVYRAFPQLGEAVSPELIALLPEVPQIVADEPVAEIHRTLSGKSPSLTGITGMTPSVSAAGLIHRTPSGELKTPGSLVLERLSYSHLEILAPIEPPLKRSFYEIECIKGGWSVRELKRQIGALYFERSGLSKDPEALARITHEGAEVLTPAHLIRDPFIFDFLGLPAGEVLTETALEDALMRHLQRFLLELGRGFCFEARQKRLLIGGEFFFCDLVFYHRILKCHVLIELKVDHFRHEHLGQLNSYLGWFREHEMQPGDQDPIGILLCTEQNAELVRYALAGLDQQLFVSRYQLELPATSELEAFLRRELERWGKSQR